VDDEPGVDREALDVDGVHVAPDVVARLVELDLVRAREDVRGRQPRDAGADDRYLHRSMVRPLRRGRMT
jgi:hypothetical protein